MSDYDLAVGEQEGRDHRPGRQSLDPFFLAKLLLNLSSCLVFLRQHLAV